MNILLLYFISKLPSLRIHIYIQSRISKFKNQTSKNFPHIHSKYFMNYVLPIYKIIITFWRYYFIFNGLRRGSKFVLCIENLPQIILDILPFMGLVFWPENVFHIKQPCIVLPILFLFNLCARIYSQCINLKLLLYPTYV